MKAKDMIKSLCFIAGIFCISFAPAAFAEDFCASGSNCVGLKIENYSSTLVKQVRIDQEKTNGACEAASQKFSQNLTGVNITGENLRGESFVVQVNPSCQYKIKYGTTSGCAGDKVAHMSPNNFNNEKDLVQLIGACGSLKTSKLNEFNAYGG